MLIDISPLRKHRNYRLLYIGQAVSFFGSMLTYVAVPYQIFELTHSSLWVGLLGTVQLVPLLVAALFGGALADAFDRRRLLVYSEVGLSCLAGVMAINASLAKPSVIVVFVASAAMSALNGLHQPSLQAMSPRLVDVEDLPAMSALSSLRSTTGMVAGPAVAGLVIARFGLAATYVIDVITFAISVVALGRINAPFLKRDDASSGLGSIAEGLRYAYGRPELIGTYVVDIIAMTFAMPMALFPSMGKLWGGAEATGWLYSAMSIGSMLMALFSGWASRVRRQGAMVVWSAALWGVAITALGFAPSLSIAVACLALAGAADMVSGLFRGAIWNETIPDKLRGRLAGVEMISYMTGPLLGNARAGGVAAWTSNTVSIASGGVLCVLGVLACIVFLPAFFRYQRPAAEPTIEPPADPLAVS
jgi:MFS family permease